MHTTHRKQKKNMNYYVTSLTFDQAEELIRSLRNVGIDSYITVGGVSIYCEEQDKGKLLEVCGDFDAVPTPNRPFAQRLVLDRENTLNDLRRLGVDI